MMITARRNDRGGFTLLEIIVVFLIIMLIVGIGSLSLTTENTKKQIITPATELKKFARRGLQMAINNRHSFAIELKPGGFSLLEGKSVMSEDAETDPRFAALFEEERENAGGQIDAFELQDDMQLEVLRWGEELFREPEDDLWIFEPSGICEPIGIKLIHPEGSVEMLFNPLTAKVQDQSLLIEGNARDF